jgi:hypothetical protein
MKLWRMVAAAGLVLLSGGAGAHGALADLSVHDRTEGRRLKVHWHEGRAYVVGKPGNEYQVVIRNRSREALLAIVSVDGVNVITGEGAHPSQSGYVLGAGSRLEVKGWRKSLGETAAFYFTSLSDSYAGRTGRPDDVGVIGVALFRKKAQAVAPAAPMARQESRAAGAASAEADTALGTGHGRREPSPATYVEFERASSTPAETVTLYYDSYHNLLARGVIRQPMPVAPLPRPFPGFVPDPQGLVEWPRG